VLGAEEDVRRGGQYRALRAERGGPSGGSATARVLARLDVPAAERAVTGRYVRPEVHDGFDLVLRASRHPVIERLMAREAFIPNDARFTEAERVALVTGPNMAGKSTILRQIGLCVVLAQMGSFVPAEAASVGTVDRLFTRVGASDNLTRGQSTFMVEMSETSAILHNAGPRSLVLLDEIGRGTSTYDGVAIAWAVTEHLHDRIGCKTMFATHYHELMQLPERLQHARNYNVAVRETGDTVVFLTARAGGDGPLLRHPCRPAGGAPAAWSGASSSHARGEHRMVPGRRRPHPTRSLMLFAGGGPHPVRRDPGIGSRRDDAARGAQPVGRAPAAGGGAVNPGTFVAALCGVLLVGGCSRQDASLMRVPADRPGSTPALDGPPVALNAESPVSYPQSLLEQGVEGIVVLHLFVDATGALVRDSTRVAESSGYPPFDSAAVAAVPLFHYAPAVRDGTPVATAFLQPVQFRNPQGRR
jgi:TonB family protein